jgi:hypothetical protein
MAMPPPPPPTAPPLARAPSAKKPASKSPQIRPVGPNSLLSDLQALAPLQAGSNPTPPQIPPSLEPLPPPVDPAVLADAVQKLDDLRLSRSPSRHTSPSASGASSPRASGIAEAGKVVAAVAGALERERGNSVPGTPHFGAATNM